MRNLTEVLSPSHYCPQDCCLFCCRTQRMLSTPLPALINVFLFRVMSPNECHEKISGSLFCECAGFSLSSHQYLLDFFWDPLKACYSDCLGTNNGFWQRVTALSKDFLAKLSISCQWLWQEEETRKMEGQEGRERMCRNPYDSMWYKGFLFTILLVGLKRSKLNNT